MGEPILDYRRPPDPPRPPRFALYVLAVVSLLAGSGLAYLFVVGLPAGDVWAIEPLRTPVYWWVIPAALVGWPIWFFCRLHARSA